ncbi:MAG: cytochrome c biogenesis CcdA family protein [Actinomycetota bacterium]
MAFAFMGGALAILNPCGFPLLVAHLSLSIGGDAIGGREPARAGLARGIAVASGFVMTLASISIPLALGLQQAVRVLPRAGLVVGVGLVVVGVLMLLGRSVSLPTRLRPRPSDGSFGSFFMLGVAQGVTALGCTLPVFLAVVGAAGASGGVTGVLATVGAYAAGAATLLVILSAGAASAGSALTLRLRATVRHVRVAGGALLVASGAYLTYFWWQLSFASSSSLNADPLVSRVQSFSSWLYRLAGSGDAALVSGALAAGLSIVLVSIIWQSRKDPGPLLEQGTRGDG